jgi:Do/DeqQ family serine protease
MATLRIPVNSKPKVIAWTTGLLFALLTIVLYGRCAYASRETPVVKAVRQAGPAVVNISSEYEIRKNSNPFSGYGIDPQLERFFRDFFSPEHERREQRTSLGSGVIIDGERGFVLTNTHVVDNATTIRVSLKDAREFEAAIVGMDPESDLAVLKIQSATPLPSIQMGDSDDILIGESVIAIGNPFGFSHTVTTGVISAVKRSIKTSDRVFNEFIQTDASINPGNSGGPLLNIDGQLIGINTAIHAQAQGIGFAIPINRAKRIVSDLINYGEVIQTWIGLSLQPLDASLSDYLNMDDVTGLLVIAVDEKSPAESAGIGEGDIVVSINDKPLTDLHAYRTVVHTLSVNQPVTMTVLTGGGSRQTMLIPRAFPLDQALVLAQKRLGVSVANLDERTFKKYGIRPQSGVLIETLRRGSQLDRIGLSPGDIIRQIDEQRIGGLDDFMQAIAKYRDKSSIVLLIQRNHHLYYVNATLKETE